MTVSMLKSKIHRATVTETSLEYVGSVTIDQSLMDAVGLLPFEHVHVWNVTSGSRIQTYAIPGEEGSGVICLNGAAAHLNQVGDKVIIASFADLSPEEIKSYKPKIVIVNNRNSIEKLL